VDGEQKMSLMVFLAICILGVDVLIYFLYEWAFGESERIRKRHPRCRFERFPVEISATTKPRSDANRAASTVIEMHPVNSTPLPSVSDAQERLAYRRLATSHAPVKRRA
jgi:hypothetical protein